MRRENTDDSPIGGGGLPLNLLMSYTPQGGTVSDPWYTRDFETAYQDILKGCEGLFEYLMQNT